MRPSVRNPEAPVTDQSPTTSSPPPNGSPAPGIDPLLRDFLASRDAACPICRYDLRGATTNRCPECGHTLALSLGGYQRLPLWWYLGFAGPVGGVGLYIWMATIGPPEQPSTSTPRRNHRAPNAYIS